MKTMKAVVINSYGGTDVLETQQVPIPEIADDEVLVKVGTVGVNPLDWKVRAGYLEGMLSYQFPLILGWDLSGTVEKAGSVVSEQNIGDEVYALADITRNGACAEYIAVKAGIVAPKPASLDHTQSASVPMAALTAWQAIFGLGELSAGQRILVHAAAGGVGSMAVQLARWKGAYVIGTASSQNSDFLLDLGADEVVDYNATPFEEVVSDVDVVLDAIGGDVQERSWSTLKKGGILVSLLGPPNETNPDAAGKIATAVFVQPDTGLLSRIAGLIDNGTLKTIVSEVLPLEEIARAQEMSETHHVRGKIVLEVV